MPAPAAEQPFRTIIQTYFCANLIVETASSRDGPGWNLQAVVLVERDSFRRPRPSVAEDHGLADKFGIGLHLANVRFAPVVLQKSKTERRRKSRKS